MDPVGEQGADQKGIGVRCMVGKLLGSIMSAGAEELGE